MQHLTERVQPIVEARSSILFNVVGAVALFFAIVSALVWSGAAAVHDAVGTNGALLFTLVAGSILVLALIAGRNVKLFASQDLVGCVGPFGGVRVCQRTELAEVRTVWHRYAGREIGSWVFPTLHFRRLDGVDAFVTAAVLYRAKGLQAVAHHLGVLIDLDRPTTKRAA
jgi:hypothetical protein